MSRKKNIGKKRASTLFKAGHSPKKKNDNEKKKENCETEISEADDCRRSYERIIKGSELDKLEILCAPGMCTHRNCDFLFFSLLQLHFKNMIKK